MKSIAQKLTLNQTYDFSRFDAYLKTVGDYRDYFDIYEDSNTVIDACNFEYLDQGENYILFSDDSLEDFSGPGFLKSQNSVATISDAASITFPILGKKEGKYYLFLRLKGNIKIDISIDNVKFNSVENSSSNWAWFSLSFVVFDEIKHNLGIHFLNSGVLLDKIIISKNSTLPTGLGEDFTDSPYFTIISRVCENLSGIPNNFLNRIDYCTSKNDLKNSSWIPFNVKNILNQSINSLDISFVLTGSGVSNNHYFIWEKSKTYYNNYLIKDSTWTEVLSKSLSLKTYINNENTYEYECLTYTPDATIEELLQEDLSKTVDPLLKNTAYTNDTITGKDVSLEVGERIVNIIIDQSGSNTWTDSTKLKISHTKSIIDSLNLKYPGDINYNLFSFKGVKTFSFFVGLKERFLSNSPSNIIRESLKEDSNYIVGFRVIRKEGAYPSSPTDGEIISDGYAVAALDSDLSENTQYFYKVYTYDYLQRFSEGIEISAKTSSLDLPRGIPWIEGKSLKGYDINRDANSIAIWNTDELEGNYSYSFGTSLNNLTLENINWISSSEAPTGRSGLRLNGINSRVSTVLNTDFSFDIDDSFSIFTWIFPFALDSNIVIMSNGTLNDLNYALILDNNVLKFTFDGVNFYSSNGIITDNEWTHIGITYNNGILKFYKNGLEVTTNDPVSYSSSTYLGESYLSLGYDSAGLSRFSGRFFGKISHISIHNNTKTSSEALDISVPKLSTDLNGYVIPIDNGDRTVVLKVIIPENIFVRIVRNPDYYPNHESDGDIALEKEFLEGRYEISLPYDYDVNEKYYFKIFTKKNDNWSPIEDSHGVEVLIPDKEREAEQDPLTGEFVTVGPGINTGIPELVILKSLEGNEKNWIKWRKPTDEFTTRVKIFVSTENFSVYDQKTKSVKGGSVIFNNSTDINEFIDRKLNNDQTYFYTVIPFDRFGACASPSRWFSFRGRPSALVNDNEIPLLEAKNVRYYIYGKNRIQINWESPIKIFGSFSGYFDDRFYIYSGICDIFGNLLPIEFPNEFSVNFGISSFKAFDIEDVFNLGFEGSDPSQIPSATYSIANNGLLSGLIRLRANTLLAVLENIKISASAIYKYSDSFVYNLPSISVDFYNPLKLSLTNRDNLYLQTKDYTSDAKGCSVDDFSGGKGKDNDPRRKRVNGMHIRSKKNFNIRAFCLYKDIAVTNASFRALIYNSTGGPCSITPSLTTNVSSTVLLAKTSFPTVIENTNELDDNGNSTSRKITVSYADIPVIAPKDPQDATVYVKCNSNGFIALGKMNLFFPGLLKISISASAPLSNSIDIKEQFAKAYLIDPDNPSDLSKITFPPDNTVAKWEIKQNGLPVKTVPFYSIDSVPLAGGVFSYFKNGTARNVFFGPASSTQSGSYTITVSASVRGLFGTASANVTIEGKTGGQFEYFIPDLDLPRILAEFDDTVNYLWSDGVDYQKMTISRDPNRSTTKYAAKFLECSNGIVLPLPIGTIINIEVKGYEILHGSITEAVLPDGTKYLEDGSAIRSNDSAQITISKSLETYVYFRKNQFIESGSCRPLDKFNNCSAFDAPEQICFGKSFVGPDTAVILTAKINFNGENVVIYGGGHFANDGRPPCVLVPVEPLFVNYLGLFINENTPIDKFLLDGSTVHYIYYQISYKDVNIESGTPFSVFACNLIPDPPLASGEKCRKINSNIGIPETVYVYNTNILPGSTEESASLISLIKIPIGPISSEEDLSIGIYPEISFIDGKSILVT